MLSSARDRGRAASVQWLAGVLCVAAALAPRPANGEARWYRGQIHVHANWQVSERVPTTSYDTILRWYLEHDYHFVVLTDLNYYKPAAGLKAVFDAPDRFLVLAGTELSSTPGGRIVDTLGLGTSAAVEPPDGDDVRGLLQEQARRIRSVGGLPVIAHPNLAWSITAEDILALAEEGPLFFEVINGEPGMNNLGGGGRPSTEQIWDRVLSAGRLLYGFGADDSHHFSSWGQQYANPGRAWVLVRAAALTQEELLAAMRRGDFYATTGVELLGYEVDERGIRIALDERPRDLGWTVPGSNPQRYRTEFIGQDGSVLKVDESPTPSYEFRGDELYLRARIAGSDGGVAWTQPVFRRGVPPPVSP
jgi:hypothetical protein